jgi:excinuclease UvrABC ATPase subunit
LLIRKNRVESRQTREKKESEKEVEVEVERMKPSKGTKNRLLEAFSCKTKKGRGRVEKEEAERTKKPINDRNLVTEDVTPLNTRYATTKCKP